MISVLIQVGKNQQQTHSNTEPEAVATGFSRTTGN